MAAVLLAGSVLATATASSTFAQSQEEWRRRVEQAGPICELHPGYNARLRADLVRALKSVQSEEHLAWIIERLMTIDIEVRRHEWAHFTAAKGWAGLPTYDYVTLYDRKYAIGGCVALNPRIPLDIALAAALAPDRPSDWDQEQARQIRELMLSDDYRMK